MLLNTRMSQTHTQIHTYRQILSSLALQTGEDAAQVSLDRAIKLIDHSTAYVNSGYPARTKHKVPLMGNQEVKTRGGRAEMRINTCG